MPKVPFSDNVVSMKPEFKPSQTDLLMAAGELHNERALFESQSEPAPVKAKD